MITGTKSQRLYEKASNEKTPNYLLTIYPYPRPPYLMCHMTLDGYCQASALKEQYVG